MKSTPYWLRIYAKSTVQTLLVPQTCIKSSCARKHAGVAPQGARERARCRDSPVCMSYPSAAGPSSRKQGHSPTRKTVGRVVKPCTRRHCLRSQHGPAKECSPSARRRSQGRSSHETNQQRTRASHMAVVCANARDVEHGNPGHFIHR